MAIVNDNIITRFQRGRFGDIIYRVVGSLSISSKAPDYSKIKWSEAQKANRMRFRDGMAFAWKAFEDPEKEKYYQNKAGAGQHKFNMAVADYMVKPKINEVDIDNYKGAEGNLIRVDASDNYKVAGVIVMILNAAGLMIESGMAVEYPYSGCGEWIYKTMESNPEWQGGKVVVRVTDSPGNIVQTFRVLGGG
jgi:hypothetical protein